MKIGFHPKWGMSRRVVRRLAPIVAALLLLASADLANSAARADDHWDGMTITYGDKRLFVACRSDVPAGVDMTLYPYLVTISWPYRPIHATGLPDASTFEAQARFEKILDRALEGTDNAYLMQVLTGDGLKAWRWYSHDATESRLIVEREMARLPSVPIKLSIDSDPNWAHWRAIPCTDSSIYAQEL